jgi:membrane peptidoglycan carboxypeptidase
LEHLQRKTPYDEFRERLIFIDRPVSPVIRQYARYIYRLGFNDLNKRIVRTIADICTSTAKRAMRFRLRPATVVKIILLIGLVVFELKTSYFQSFIISQWAQRMDFTVQNGPNEDLIFPEDGPFDKRLGYTRVPDFTAALVKNGFVVERQARTSGAFRAFQHLGGFPPYREKTSAGMTLLAAGGKPYFTFRQPAAFYSSYDAVPAPVVASLLFVENRELLDTKYPRRNPAVEWRRFGLALFQFGSRGPDGSSPGGSTVATQMEKLRHSPGGRTANGPEKLRQMLSASIRAYKTGTNTTAFRQQVLVDALNMMPLAGFPEHGEVIGIGDGLELWYGADFVRVNRLLNSPAKAEADLRSKGLALKQVLSLVIAQRRPGYYLGKGREDLETLTESYLRLMSVSGHVDTALAEAAASSRLRFNEVAPVLEPMPPATAKSATAIRNELTQLIGVPSFYDLHRLDLTVETTLNADAQEQSTHILRSLSDPKNLSALGLSGFGLQGARKAARVNYSFTLYERGKNVNYLRVQTDSLDQPLDVNVGTKLELGSTAKVRTLITYLNIIATVFEQHRKNPASRLKAIVANGDPLSAWVAGQLLETGDKGLPTMLDAAMEKRYSASSGERFFTAGGLHHFSNFNRRHGGYMSVSYGLQQSVNLIFIRIMRDIVDYHIAHIPGTEGILDDPAHPARKEYLRRFIDMEGRQYLDRFLPDYRGLDRPGILRHIAERTKFVPSRLAAAYRTVRPKADYQAFAVFINRWSARKVSSDAAMRKLYEAYAPDRLDLADRSYISRIHPLELWLAGYLYEQPKADWKSIVTAGADVRQESYKWLLKPNRFKAQNTRIRTMLERDAFVPIHKDWQRVGYPFSALIPSYATAIGTSGDRPDALAELMGVIISDGHHYPAVRINRLRFAEGAPYETVMKASPAVGLRVLRPEIARVVRLGLIDVVQNGTARRANDAIAGADGKPLLIGGKTGTGDNRQHRFGRGGRSMGSDARSRTATFVFFAGNRVFGTVTAYVEGPEADQYSFTSALPAQLFKALAPVIEQVIDEKPSSTSWDQTPRVSVPDRYYRQYMRLTARRLRHGHLVRPASGRTAHAGTGAASTAPSQGTARKDQGRRTVTAGNVLDRRFTADRFSRTEAG